MFKVSFPKMLDTSDNREVMVLSASTLPNPSGGVEYVECHTIDDEGTTRRLLCKLADLDVAPRINLVEAPDEHGGGGLIVDLRSH